MFARRIFMLPLALAALSTLAVSVQADGPADNHPDRVRPVPPKGTVIPAPDKEKLRSGLAELQGEIRKIDPKNEMLPDVLIFEKAVRWALDYDEVFERAPKNAKRPPQANNVKKVLAAGLERARQLKDGKHPWTTRTGYVVRGYRSFIDGSVQPYGLLVPKEYDFNGKSKHRLDFWWHGRGETLSEANFMANPQNASGIIPVPGQFIVYPYGRYCNANKFAGEVDSAEILDELRRKYRIDESRIVARGFSMGGAACWQFAVHYPTLWCANAPGAGFSETADFLKVFQREPVNPPWYEQKLWHMYDCTDYAANLFNLPTVAYSGENDSQKQAADMMEKALAKEGMKLVHIIGPKAKHFYEKGARAEVNKRIDAIVAKGKPSKPDQFRFTTFTLKYNECGRVVLTGLGRHWERARVDGEKKDGKWILKTRNVTSLAIRPTQGTPPGKAGQDEPIVIDGSEVTVVGKLPFTRFHKVNGKWETSPLPDGSLAKVPNLQGPIDDAFMDRFVMVAPSGKPMNEKAGAWAAGEMKHAIEHWRKQFRGDAIVKKDTEIKDADIKFSNLVLWGDPSSNAVLAKIADKLPIKWTAKGIQVGDKTYDATKHVPVFIFPNPLSSQGDGLYSSQKYVVINSGFTYREYDYLNNARQVSKLPDYAIVDITTPPNSRYPGKIVRAGFFGEKWELRKDDGRVASTSAAPPYRVLAQDKNHVAIVGKNGAVEWEVKCPYNSHDLQALPNGNFLLHTAAATVAEMTPKKEIVWKYEAQPLGGQKRVEIHAFQRLPDGNTMVAESGNRRIVEVSPKGEIVKQIPLVVRNPNPHRDTRMVRKLPSGNYLVCHESDGCVREYSPQGKVLWEYALDLGGRPRSSGHGPEGHGNEVFGALRLPSGNTLIAGGNNNRVFEVNRAGKIVWSIEQKELPGITLAWVTTLQVLPNGNIIVGNCHAGPDNPQLFEVTRDKKVVWTFKNHKVFGNSTAAALVLDVPNVLR